MREPAHHVPTDGSRGGGAAPRMGPLRRLGVLAAAGALGLLAPAGAPGAALAQAPDAEAVAVVELSPSLIQLGSAPVQVAIQVREVPPLGTFDLTLDYDGTHAVVTAVEPGDYLATADGPGAVRLRAAEPGRLRLTGEIRAAPAEGVAEGDEGAAGNPEDTDAGGAVDPAAAPEGAAPAPLTAGTLALVTLAPLQRSEGSLAIEVAGVALADAAGTAVEATGLTAQFTVVEDPTDEARAEAERQAALLADTVDDSALSGIADTVRRSFGQVGGQLRGFAVNPIVAWLAILAGALAVVGIGWQLGRRPVIRGGHAGSTAAQE